MIHQKLAGNLKARNLDTEAGETVVRKHLRRKLRSFEENKLAISYGEPRVKGHC